MTPELTSRPMNFTSGYVFILALTKQVLAA